MSIVGWIITALAAGVGSFFGGYLRKKGENQAIHEDIGKLVEQVQAATTTAKTIEAKISDEVWDRQRRWEMKRDVLFELARKATLARDALGRLIAMYATGDGTQRAKLTDEWNAAMADFHGMGVLVAAVCDQELWRVGSEFGEFLRSVAERIVRENESIPENTRREIAEKARQVAMSIRKELGLANATTRQSTECSAAPNPAASTPE